MRIIGLTGPAGAGKTTIAHAINRQVLRSRTISFAEPIKLMMAQVLAYAGVSQDQITRCLRGDLKEVRMSQLADRSPRYAMQTLGTEWGRNMIGTDFWLNLAMLQIEQERKRKLDVIVIDDVRFDSEAKALLENGGEIFLLSGRGGISGSHISESGLSMSVKIIDNIGTPQEVASQILNG